MDGYTRNRIQSLKDEIYKCEKLSEVGLDLYKENKNPDTLHAAIYWESEKDRLIKSLKNNYGINYLVED